MTLSVAYMPHNLLVSVVGVRFDGDYVIIRLTYYLDNQAINQSTTVYILADPQRPEVERLLN